MEFYELLPPFRTMVTSIHLQFSNFRQSFSNPGAYMELTCPTFFCSVTCGFGILLLAATAAPMWLLYSSNKKKKAISEVNGDLPLASDFGVPLIVEDDDSTYSMELQIQEVLLASLAPNFSKPSSIIQERVLLDTELIENENENENENIQLQNFCEICLEDRESWQMFKNFTCSHSFCYECTSKHIVARIEENLKMIRCPGANCKATLDFDACRLMTPKNVLSKWDEFLCVSSVPDSQKLFCPFSDCSALLIDDSGEVIQEIKCPGCHRSFCAQCRVPWHPEFTCKKFQKLNSRKSGKDESLFESLAKKKLWQKCPSCKIHVEKIEGCIHITCRCSYEFCYRCGSKWCASHRCKSHR